MFRALVQVASIKSFSGCHATTTLIQISTAKLSFLGSQVLDASPWILFRLWTVCSLESIAFEKKNLNKIQFNYSQFNGLIYNSPHTKINSPLFVILINVKLNHYIIWENFLPGEFQFWSCNPPFKLFKLNRNLSINTNSKCSACVRNVGLLSQIFARLPTLGTMGRTTSCHWLGNLSEHGIWCSRQLWDGFQQGKTCQRNMFSNQESIPLLSSIHFELRHLSGRQ